MPTRPPIPAVFCLVLSVCVCASMVAPSPLVRTVSAQTAQDIERAKERFREGKELYESEDYYEAAVAFEEAYELSGRSELLYNVGRSYWRADKLKKAEKYFQQYLNELPDARNADEVVESIIEIQEQMAAQMANVDIQATRPGIEIFVDDEPQPRCTTPCTISVLPGSRTVTARPEGMEPMERTLEVKAEQQTSMSFDLPGRLAISTDQRSGTVSVDGHGSFELPLREPIELSAGAHRVSVQGTDEARWSGTIDVVGGEVTRILVPLSSLESDDETNILRSASYGLAGASVGLLVGGVFLGMQASDTHATLESQQQALGGVDPKMVERGKSEQLGANILYALSATTLASGAGLFAWDLYGGTSSEDQIAPSAEQAVDAGADPDETPAASEGDELLDLGASGDDDSSDEEEEPAEEEEDEEAPEDENELF